MRFSPFALPIALVISVIHPHAAGAVGCVSGAVAGGVAGHYAGHHGLLGAAAGCAVGHHLHKVQQEQEREEAARQHAYDSPDYQGDTGPSDQNGSQKMGENPR